MAVLFAFLYNLYRIYFFFSINISAKIKLSQLREK